MTIIICVRVCVREEEYNENIDVYIFYLLFIIILFYLKFQKNNNNKLGDGIRHSRNMIV